MGEGNLLQCIKVVVYSGNLTPEIHLRYTPAVSAKIENHLVGTNYNESERNFDSYKQQIKFRTVEIRIKLVILGFEVYLRKSKGWAALKLS